MIPTLTEFYLWIVPLSLCCQGYEAYHYLNMSRVHPECPKSDPSDRSLTTDVLLRQEPDDEDDEEDEEDEDKEEDDDEEGDDNEDDDGYSE